jgi:SAM-dependent methyltransferase
MTPNPPVNILYEQRQLPIFQNRMYDTAEEARSCPKGDICLVEDLTSGLVYNAAFRPELMVYDAHYQNEQAVSPLFQEHLEMVASIIDRTMGRESIVEIGCGKGFFLELLLAKGFEISGFDPTYEGMNPRVMKRYFEAGVGLRGKGLVLRHVMEHIQNPVQFLHQLKEANGGGGKIYIEVPLFDWICDHRAWFDIFYEHVNYFRISDFHRMFGKVIESGTTFGGQYLYVVADLSTIRTPKVDVNDRVRFPNKFTETLLKNPSENTASVIWGGASKGVIFALLKERHDQPVNMVIDINPAKQGKFLAATGLQVVSPSQAMAKMPAGSTLYIMNSNYTKEIQRMSNNTFRYVAIDQ